jgi:hypothetical protein
MKRIHLFEFEDFSWFPHWLRIRLTRLINVMHDLLKTDQDIAKLLKPLIDETKTTQIIDLCSGSGGPMPNVLNQLVYDNEMEKLNLTLTDLYPDMSSAKKFQPIKNISYYTKPVNVTQPNQSLRGLRSMICSFHHMKPEVAKSILKSAEDENKPIFIYEISDNSTPKYLWWLALPINFIMCLFITPMVKPMTWQQLFFTYILPIIPLFFAWDGAVSNARTYTLKDMDELLEGLGSDKYKWTKGVTEGKMKKIFLYGQPV